MPNTTDTYWEADGQSLHTYAASIETLSGMGVPSFRGDDFVVPFRPGQVWVPKTVDSNTLTLAMWLRGVSPSAGPGAVAETKMAYQSNWNDLIRLLWTPGRQVQLTKRFYDGGILRTATALSEYAGQMKPTMMGRTAAKCTIDMKLADPNFYDVNTLSVPLPDGTTPVTVPGNNYTYNMTFTLNGARNNLLIENLTTGVQFTYSGQIPSGSVVTLKPMDFSSMEQAGANPAVDTSVRVLQAGSPFWFNLAPGINNIRVSSSSGTGTVTLQVKGAWV